MFKKDFVWGAATAAYQVEGGAFEDRRGGMPRKAGLENRYLIPAIHNTLLAHGKAVIALRETVKYSKISYAPCGDYFYPLDENNPADIKAARKLTFRSNDNFNVLHWNVAGHADVEGYFQWSFMDNFEWAQAITNALV